MTVEEWGNGDLITRSKMNRSTLRRVHNEQEAQTITPNNIEIGDMFFNKAESVFEVSQTENGGFNYRTTRMMNFICQQDLHYSVPQDTEHEVFKHHFIYFRGLCENRIITRIWYKPLANVAGLLKVVLDDGNIVPDESFTIQNSTNVTPTMQAIHQNTLVGSQHIRYDTLVGYKVVAKACEIFHIDVRGY